MTQYQTLLLDFTSRPIRSEREYRRALTFIEKHMEPRPPKAEAELLELLSTLVVDYESRTYPEPEVSPGQMLAHLIDARGVTKAETARATGIPRGTISNVISGNREISKANAVTLSKYFHVSPAVFLPTVKS